MAKTRKSAKRSVNKKRGAAKPASARKRPARKAPAKRSAKSAAGRAKKSRGRTRRPTTLGGVAREGVETVRQVGDRAWDALRSTTAQVVEGVRERFGDDSERDTPHRRGE